MTLKILKTLTLIMIRILATLTVTTMTMTRMLGQWEILHLMMNTSHHSTPW